MDYSTKMIKKLLINSKLFKKFGIFGLFRGKKGFQAWEQSRRQNIFAKNAIKPAGNLDKKFIE